ncbi:MAG: hypothetical protein C0600_10180 [Ignavibacteria bacterium]|nr:MAG: hypothetical protein C0600_10180 [Ignavibacteria bacterium]
MSRIFVCIREALRFENTTQQQAIPTRRQTIIRRYWRVATCPFYCMLRRQRERKAQRDFLL